MLNSLSWDILFQVPRENVIPYNQPQIHILIKCDAAIQSFPVPVTIILRRSIVLQTCWLIYSLGPSSCPAGPEVATAPEMWPWETSNVYPSAINIHLWCMLCCEALLSIVCWWKDPGPGIRQPKLESWLCQLLVFIPWDRDSTFFIFNFYIAKWVR